MPLWIYVYTPWIMALYMLAALVVNFGFLCAASTCADDKPKPLRFAIDRLGVTFISAALSGIAAFGIMGAFLTYGDSLLQKNLRECNYDKGTVWVPILACIAAAVVMYWMTRIFVLGRRVSDKMNRTMLCGCFALLNTPYILLVPMVIK